MFKFLVVFCLLVVSPEVLGMSEEMLELMAMLRETCVGESGVDASLVEKANNEKVLVDDEKLKCYIKCIFDQMAVIDDNGKIDVEGVIAVIPEEVAEKAVPAVRKCGSKVGANPCDNSWLTHQCWLAEAPSAYMLP